MLVWKLAAVDHCIVSIGQQLYLRFASLAFKCMIACPPDYLCKKIVKRCGISLKNSRNSQLLNIPLYRTAAGQRSFHYRFEFTWNNLKPKLKLSKSTKEFKYLFKKKDILKESLN